MRRSAFFIRIALLILGVCAVPIILNQTVQHIILLVAYHESNILNNPSVSPSPSLLLTSAFGNVCALVFISLYVVYTLKNGFAKTLYSSIALSIEDLKTAREKRALLRKEKKIRGLQESLDKLNQKSDE